MTRKKVKLEFIKCDSARRASLKKRRLGLMKKVSEITILCGISAAVIVYSPDEVEPAVWPSYTMVLQLLARFQGMPQLERLKKMNNQETYLKDRVSKAVELLTKMQRRNKEVEMGQLMHQIDKGKGLDEFNLSELKRLTWLVEEKMKEIRKRIGFFQRVPHVPGSGPPLRQVPLPTQGPAVNETTPLGSGSAGLGGHGTSTTPIECLLWDDWFIDMMNNNEHKSACTSSLRSDMDLPYYHPFAGNATDDHLGLPRHSFGGSSSFAADHMEMGLPHGNFKGLPTDMDHPPLIFRRHARSNDHMRLPLGDSSIAGGNFCSFVSDTPSPSDGHIGTSSTGTEFALPPLPPSELSGSSSHGTVSDMIRLPFDGKTWTDNFFP